MVSTKIRRRGRSLLFWLLLLAGGYLALKWMRAHPEDVPFAPFKLAHPVGYATRGKLVELGDDIGQCHAILAEGGIRYQALPPTGSGSCRANDRTRIAPQASYSIVLIPADVAPSCAVSAALLLWQREVVAPAAQAHFGKAVIRIEHFGSYNCRTVAGRDYMSEHATGNAIDIAAFILADGTRVSVLKDWRGGNAAKMAFLRQLRDGGCDIFSTTLSPDYNKAHADHFHFDMAQRMGGYGVCR